MICRGIMGAAEFNATQNTLTCLGMLKGTSGSEGGGGGGKLRGTGWFACACVCVDFFFFVHVRVFACEADRV